MIEKVRVLTRERKDTGIRKERGALQEGDFVEVIHLWVKSPEGRHLLQKRSAQKTLFPLAWDAAAAGAVRIEETPADAAVREIAEELSIPAQVQDISLLFTVEYEQGFDDYFLLMVPEDIPLTLDEEEVAEAKWFDTDEVLALMDDGLFCDHQGTTRMEELLREERLRRFIDQSFEEISFAPEGRMFLKGEKESLLFTGVTSFEGQLYAQSAVLKELTCKVEGKRQHWTLAFASQRLQVHCAQVEAVENEQICPVCAREADRGAIYANQQINWTPEGSKVGVFARPTRWSMGKHDRKLADYFLRTKARFPLHYCPHCRLFYSDSKIHPTKGE